MRGSNTSQGASSHTSNSPLHDEEGGSRHNSSASIGSSAQGSSARTSSLETAAAPPTALSLIQQMPKGAFVNILCVDIVSHLFVAL